MEYKDDKYAVVYTPVDLGKHEKKIIIMKLKQQLKSWSRDMTIDQAKAVRKMYFAWHPDRQRGADEEAKEKIQFVFQAIQEEVRQLKEDKERRQKKFDKVKNEREFKQSQKNSTKSSKNKGDKSNLDDKQQLNIAHNLVRPWPRAYYTLTQTDELNFAIFGGECAYKDQTVYYGELHNLQFSKDNLDDAKSIMCNKLYRAQQNVPGPSARSSHQCCYSDNSLYLFGGSWSSSNGVRYKQFDDLWQYDIEKGTWEELGEKQGKKQNTNPNYPCTRNGHKMVAYEDHLYIFGGYIELKNGNAKYFNDLYSYNIKEKKWLCDKRKISKPCPRSGFAMWIWEGILDEDVDEDVDEEEEFEEAEFDDENEAQSDNEKSSEKQEQNTIQKRLYIFGGTSNNQKVLSDCWYFDLNELKWYEVVLKNQKKVFGILPRYKFSYFKSGANKLIVFGGQSEILQQNFKKGSLGLSGYYNDIIVLNLEKLSWEIVWQPYAVSLTDLSKIKLIQGTLEDYGGVDIKNVKDLSNQKKKKVDQFTNFNCNSDDENDQLMPLGRTGCQCMTIEDQLYVYAGECEDKKKEITFDDLWSFDFKEKSWKCLMEQSSRNKEFQDSEDEEEYTEENIVNNTVINEEQKEEQKTEEKPDKPIVTALALVHITDPSQLSKKNKLKWEKKQRSEVKAVKQQEKEKKKLQKKEEKQNKQKEKEKSKGKPKKKKEEEEDNDDEDDDDDEDDNDDEE